MPAARPNLPDCPPRTRLEEPLSLAECIAELTELLIEREM